MTIPTTWRICSASATPPTRPTAKPKGPVAIARGRDKGKDTDYNGDPGKYSKRTSKGKGSSSGVISQILSVKGLRRPPEARAA
eukprot:6263188-Lingulodinium_polyedra.AAC.1